MFRTYQHEFLFSYVFSIYPDSLVLPPTIEKNKTTHNTKEMDKANKTITEHTNAKLERHLAILNKVR